MQRVLSAALKFNDEVLATIGKGLVILLTFNKGDTKVDADWMAQKALRARIWGNAKSGKKWDTNAIQNKFDVLIVHQPLFMHELPTELPLEDEKEEAQLYADFVAKAMKTHPGDKVKAAAYGKQAAVDIVGDGPVTIVLYSAQGEGDEGEEKKEK